MARNDKSGSTRGSMGSTSNASLASEDKVEAPAWRFSQWFKKMAPEDSLPESDLLSAIEFDKTGEFLATGDRGGRVVVLRSDDSKSGKLHYKFHCEYQSHDAEFDYVRSQAIEEKINKIKWLSSSNNSQFVLTTNDRAIKMWKLHEKEIKFASGFNVTNDKGQRKPSKKLKSLRLPRSEVVETLVTATPKRLYSSDLHKFNIHSLCVSNDGETFISADNLTINQWHVDQPTLCYKIVDVKPLDMATLTEVITTAELDSHNNHIFMYGTNRGIINLCDMRERALLDKPTKEFVDPSLEAAEKKAASSAGGTFPNRPFLADMLRSISDVKFTQQGQVLVSRSYMELKLWDVRNTKAPFDCIPVHEYLSAKLWELYENELIFDCFDVAVNERGDLLTGSYGNFFHIYDRNNNNDTLIEASKPPLMTSTISRSSSSPGSPSRDSKTKSIKKKRMSRPGIVSLLGRKKKSKDPTPDSGIDIDINGMNFEKRIMQLAWHPDANAVAVAGENNLFIYSK